MTTLFVTGGTGFIGSSLVRRAVESGLDVEVLTRSEASAARVREMKATPVIGDLAVPGPWQAQAAEAATVVHLAQPETYGARVTKQRAEVYRDSRLVMDQNLLGALGSSTQRVVYVAGTSYYGDQGTTTRDESTTPNPKGWGPYIAPAIDLLPGYVDRGLPIVQAFPGWVYGAASWFAEYTLLPLWKRKPLVGLMGRVRTVSPVHQEDVARALLHLLEAGAVGQRYFIVDDQPIPQPKLPEVAAQALGVPLRTRRVPAFVCTLYLGPVVTESLTCDFCLSNRRLKATGFTFDYPTVEQGIPEVAARWLRSQLS